jgi:uncharacterized iron-regulated protein
MMRDCNWLLLICIVLPAGVHAEWQSPYYQDHPLAGEVYSLRDSKPVSTDNLYREIQNHRMILLGETHSNPDHHLGQAEIIHYLVDRNDSVSLYMEMLPYETWDPRSAEGLSLDELVSLLEEQAKGWDWKSYSPVLKASIEHGLLLNGANLTREQRANYAHSEECILTRGQQTLNFCEVLDNDRRATIKQLIYDAHCEYLPLEHTGPMANTQIAKDASFALSMLEAHDSEKVLLIAGKIHVRNDIGVPVHLQRLGAESISIAFIVVDPERTEISDYFDDVHGQQFDYAVFTPNDRNQDPCIEFADKLKKLKH